MTDAEIIELLGGVTSVARMLDIKPPSVSGWLETGIPEGRLRDLAGQIELKSCGRFTRKERWPEKYHFYWPELAQDVVSNDEQAIQIVAEARTQSKDVPPAVEISRPDPPGNQVIITNRRTGFIRRAEDRERLGLDGGNAGRGG